jgi:hypothetical protein
MGYGMNVNDPVNRPSHYTQHPSGIECIEVTRLLPFTVGNAWKYVHRAGLKRNAREDLEKARWYLQQELQDFQKDRIPAFSEYLSTVISDEAFDYVEEYLKYEPDPLLTCVWQYALHSQVEWLHVALYLLNQRIKQHANVPPLS